MTIFLATLKDVETLLTAKKYLPTGNAVLEPFIDLLERYTISLEQQYNDGVSNMGALKVEPPRLISLYGSLEKVPKAKNIIKTILEREIEIRSVSESEGRNKSMTAHLRNILLNLWHDLQSAKANKVTVEDAVLTALLSDFSVPAAIDNETAAPCPWSVPVKIIVSSSQMLNNVHLQLVNYSAKSKTELHIHEKTPADRDPRIRIDITDIRTVQFSVSRLKIGIYYNEVSEYADIWMHTLKEAELLIQELKGVRLFIRIENMDITKEGNQDGSLNAKRSHSNFEELGSPARAVKLKYAC